MENIIYFIAFVGGEQSKVTVIDLAYETIYERNDFSAVNDDNYHDLDKALSDAKKLADKYDLEYVPFDSRYNKSLSEKRQLTL